MAEWEEHRLTHGNNVGVAELGEYFRVTGIGDPPRVEIPRLGDSLAPDTEATLSTS
jgi:hypothetical protein